MKIHQGLVLALFAFTSSLASASIFPQTVESLDLNSYRGRWYEVASTQPSFQEGCVCVTADYSLQDDGNVKVVNSCRKESPDGLLNVVEGEAKGTRNPAKFKVSFGGFQFPFSNYWVVDLAPDYRYAVVSSLLRTPIWILSRSPELAEADRTAIFEKLKAEGFNTDKISPTPQEGCSYTPESK